MTIIEAITYADEIKPNSYTQSDKIKWLSQVDGTVKKEIIDTPPRWCSVDLRDGNQALIIPMSLEEKLEFFKLLCEVGFF